MYTLEIIILIVRINILFVGIRAYPGTRLENHKFNFSASGSGKIGNTPNRHSYSGVETLDALSFLCIQLDVTNLCDNNVISIYIIKTRL